MAGRTGSGKSSDGEALEEILARVDADELRAFALDMARDNEALERELRARFGRADAKQAKRDLQTITTTLMKRYEKRGFIDWRGSLEFENEYESAVESIVRPFVSAGDAGALVDLAVVRLVQLQRICIDDSNGFFSSAMRDVSKHIDLAFKLGDEEQRARLFAMMTEFLDKNPGKDRGQIYWFEQEEIAKRLERNFAREKQFAPAMIELADRHAARYPPEMKFGRDVNKLARDKWARTRILAMSTAGAAVSEMRAYAEEHDLLGYAEVVRILADAYMSCDAPQEAMDILRANLDASEPRYTRSTGEKAPRNVDYLEKVAGTYCSESEMMQLYLELLAHDWHASPKGSVDDADLCRWHDELRRIVGEDAWNELQEKLLAMASYSTASALLAHEGRLDELMEHILANEGVELEKYESVLKDVHPEPYVEHHLRYARMLAEDAYDRRGYREAAKGLAEVAKFRGGREQAQAVATEIVAANPRKTAFVDELRKAGFEV